MRLAIFGFAAVTSVLLSAPASAQSREIGYPKGSLAAKAIAAGDYKKAELQLHKEFRIAADDPARLINHGHVLARTGRTADAARLFKKAVEAEDVELLLADGRVMSSRQAARLALQSVAGAAR